MIWGSPLQPGDRILIGSKEVEIDSILSQADYMAGRQFAIDKNPACTAFDQPRCLAGQSKRGFRIPLLNYGTLPAKRSFKLPTPRYDPEAPNALVMPRPPVNSVPSSKYIVEVVVDPYISQHLRPHQREGVKFVYETVMGFKSLGYEGAILADEMGMGKTLQTIALLWTLLKQNPIYDIGSKPVVAKALIVCPVTLMDTWRKEFLKWLGTERIGVLVAGDKTSLRDFTAGRVYNVMVSRSKTLSLALPEPIMDTDHRV